MDWNYCGRFTIEYKKVCDHFTISPLKVNHSLSIRILNIENWENICTYVVIWSYWWSQISCNKSDWRNKKMFTKINQRSRGLQKSVTRTAINDASLSVCTFTFDDWVAYWIVSQRAGMPSMHVLNFMLIATYIF